MCVILINEVIFKTRLNRWSYYVKQRLGTVIESQYLKPTFKIERSILGIWQVITSGKTGLIHFLDKKSQMTLEIYVDQVLRPLAVLFDEECLREIEEIIYMDDSAGYYIFKYTKNFCSEVGLLLIIWLS